MFGCCDAVAGCYGKKFDFNFFNICIQHVMLAMQKIFPKMVSMLVNQNADLKGHEVWSMSISTPPHSGFTFLWSLPRIL